MLSEAPIIGVACGHQSEHPERYYVNAPYIRAIVEAGGTPLLIPYMGPEQLKQIVDRLDGVLIPGGIDIDPVRFGELPHPNCGSMDPIWDDTDVTITRFALELDLPVLAICRGIQVLNVAKGGTLIQDIPAQLQGCFQHAQNAPRWHATHPVSLQSGTKLNAMFGAGEVRVNSFHHQSIKDIAPGFCLAASAPDGVIEAIESLNHQFVVGVQWHPELMIDHHQLQRKLFSELIRYSKQREGRRE